MSAGGWVTASGDCVGCGRLFSFNPRRVPSVRLDGEKRPICRDCVARVNPKRVANGLDPIEILPDAYDPLRESEL